MVVDLESILDPFTRNPKLITPLKTITTVRQQQVKISIQQEFTIGLEYFDGMGSSRLNRCKSSD